MFYSENIFKLICYFNFFSKRIAENSLEKSVKAIKLFKTINISHKKYLTIYFFIDTHSHIRMFYEPIKQNNVINL